MAEHKLKGAVLEGTRDGITATCTCGWTSGPCSHSATANAAFKDHQERALVDYTDRDGKCRGCGNYVLREGHKISCHYLRDRG